MSNKFMIFRSNRKKVEFVVQCHVWKESGVMTQGRREFEVGTLFQSNDKTHVIAENVLNYF